MTGAGGPSTRAAEVEVPDSPTFTDFSQTWRSEMRPSGGGCIAAVSMRSLTPTCCRCSAIGAWPRSPKRSTEVPGQTGQVARTHLRHPVAGEDQQDHGHPAP